MMADDNMTPVKPRSTAHKKTYFPLKTVFGLAFSIVLLLSASIATISYYRLVAFGTLLDDTTMKSLPTVMTYAKMYSQVNELTYATESLTSANTQGQRRIAGDQLKQKISAIPPLAKKLADEQRFLAQITIIDQEIDALDRLIEERLDIRQQLAQQKTAIYRIHDIAIHDPELAKPMFAQAVSSLIILAEEALMFKRITQIKRSIEAITREHAALSERGFSPVQQQLFDKLHNALTSEQGILQLKSQQLRIFGRTRGRTDFVRNLVIDYARLAEYESFKYKQSVIQETGEFSLTVEQQTKRLGIAAIFVLFVIVVIVFFIQRRVIRRLLLLNQKVISRLAGENSDLKVHGNDEITDIARSFDQFAKTIEQQTKALVKTSLTDGLTNIANRRALDDAFNNLLLSAYRQQWPLAVLMMDVDNFKAYNDHYGHIAGDDCLQKIAKALKKALKRPEDFVARYGGEEFVCLLPNTSRSGAQKVAQSILDCLTVENIPHIKSNVAPHVTVSIGIYLYEAGQQETSDSILKHADKALYRAKKQGKNCYAD